MKYLICQDWRNTTDNHAGMKHMCRLLMKNFPNDYKIIIFPDLLSKTKINNSVIKKIYHLLLRKIIVPYKYRIIGKALASEITPQDQIYLLEYCERIYPQISLAEYLRTKFPDIKISALVHLVPQKLRNLYTKRELSNWVKPVDKILTFGTSLSNFFTDEIGLSKNKVETLFHYVDLDYYKPKERIKNNYPKVIVMGNQKRNFDLLHEIVTKNQKIHFTICQGVLNLAKKFNNCNNVSLIGFVEEDELLSLMQKSDISLNIMDDTIGSNVITSSMAVGLAMIVSDIGSIRDYCNVKNSIFCNNDEISFSKALYELLENRTKLESLKINSRIISQQFSIQNLSSLLK